MQNKTNGEEFCLMYAMRTGNSSACPFDYYLSFDTAPSRSHNLSTTSKFTIRYPEMSHWFLMFRFFNFWCFLIG